MPDVMLLPPSLSVLISPSLSVPSSQILLVLVLLSYKDGIGFALFSSLTISAVQASLCFSLQLAISSGFTSRVLVFRVSLHPLILQNGSVPFFALCNHAQLVPLAWNQLHRKKFFGMLSEPMEREQTHSSSRYGRPPWLFKGSAVYQLHLVKAETARVFIPKEFRLVEAFGYTLGGFFLASYDDSPAGTFDELVVIAGIVWNPPTSCAWAARVLVNSGEACAHGRKAVGLPSQVARFSKTIRPIPKTSKDKRSSFLDKVGAFTSHSPKSCIEVQVSEFKGQTPMNICNINFSAAGLDSSKWMGPLIKMSLPSFSGRTKYNPHLLKYSCQIECRVRVVPPAKVSATVGSEEEKYSGSEMKNGEHMQNKRNLCLSVMLSKPILALQFNCLKMKVEAPIIVAKPSQNSLRQ